MPLMEHLAEYKAIEGEEGRRASFIKFVKRQKVRSQSYLSNIRNHFKRVWNVRSAYGKQRRKMARQLQAENVKSRNEMIVTESARRSARRRRNVKEIGIGTERRREKGRKRENRDMIGTGIVRGIETGNEARIQREIGMDEARDIIDMMTERNIIGHETIERIEKRTTGPQDIIEMTRTRGDEREIEGVVETNIMGENGMIRSTKENGAHPCMMNRRIEKERSGTRTMIDFPMIEQKR